MARTQTDINISLPNGVSTVQWSEERIRQVDDLTRLLNVVATLNNGSCFLDNCDEAIDIAKSLSAQWITQPSFVAWLRQVCAERKEKP